MKPYNPGGHIAYQNHLVSQMLSLGVNSVDTELMSIANQFYQLDLSYIDRMMESYYSVLGAIPRLPSDMIRSILLSLKLKITSLTKWVKMLRRVPAYAVISGFTPGDTPGVGTFYDFYHRLWCSDSLNLASHFKSPKAPPSKPPKGEKAAPTDKITVEDLIAQYQAVPYSTDQPYALLFDIYRYGFLNQSVQQGLVDLNNLHADGDGTPVYTSVRMRSRKLTPEETIVAKNPKDEKYYSQPDCDIGWDSSRDCYYHGYDLYLLTAAEGNAKKTLPIFPLLDPASMHDAIGFIHCYYAVQAFLHPTISKICLDSAHDNMATYRLLNSENITPFICLNTKGAKTYEEQGIRFGVDGIPICQAGLKLTRDGVEVKRGRAKYRCPYAWSDIHKCEYCDECCSSPYGKVVHTAVKDNPRFFNIPPRESDEWKQTYKARTAAERDNKRIKLDYLLEQAHHRSTCYWYCRLYCILMCIHMDAWEISATDLKQALLSAA